MWCARARIACVRAQRVCVSSFTCNVDVCRWCWCTRHSVPEYAVGRAISAAAAAAAAASGPQCNNDTVISGVHIREPIKVWSWCAIIWMRSTQFMCVVSLTPCCGILVRDRYITFELERGLNVCSNIPNGTYLSKQSLCTFSRAAFLSLSASHSCLKVRLVWVPAGYVPGNRSTQKLN